MLLSTFLCCFLFIFSSMPAQQISQTVFGSIGFLNYSKNEVTSAPRLFNWSVGYQRRVINNRFRLVPCISFGNYQGGFLIQDGPPKGFYSSTNFKLGLDYDFFKSTNQSFFVGLGINGNYSRGHVVIEYNDYMLTPQKFWNADGGFDFKLGFRKMKKDAVIGYEIIFANYTFGILRKYKTAEISSVRLRLLIPLIRHRNQ